MSETMKRNVVQILIPVVVSVLVGIGSSAVTQSFMLVRLEERITMLERDMGRHEAALEKDLRRAEANSEQIARRTEDQERRLARTETALEGLRSDTAEIKQDVKTLLTNPKK